MLKREALELPSSFRGVLYSRFVAFKTSQTTKVIPQKLFWLAIIVILIIVHSAKDKLGGAIFKLIQYLPPAFWQIDASKNNADFILYNFAIPLKSLVFLVAFLLLAYPIFTALVEAQTFWTELKLKKIAVSSLGIFLILTLLIFPYHYPDGLNSNIFGLSGMGIDYSQMSLNPFAENTGYHYRRILKPAIAHFIQLDGFFLYYLLSLFCTYILIFMTLVFFESKQALVWKNKTNQQPILKSNFKFLCYLSIATSSYVTTDFLWPGYADQITFILILIMACIPMNGQARLGAVTLCMVNHEASAFALIPIILFCFPKQERKEALFVIFLYFSLWTMGNGFNLYRALEPYEVITVDRQTIAQKLLQYPGQVLVGIFTVYKLFWLMIIYIIGMLWQQKEKMAAIAILSIISIPIFMIFIAADLARVVSYGFLGLLISLSIFLVNLKKLPKPIHHLLISVMIINIIIPSYPIILGYPPSLLTYPYRGLYQLVHSFF